MFRPRPLCQPTHLTQVESNDGTRQMSGASTPPRRSIYDRIAHLKESPNPLVETDLNVLDGVGSTASFSVAETGELVVDEAAPLPLSVERSQPRGNLEASMARAYHLLLVPDEVTPDDVEALAVSVWNEAGWLAPGILQLQESVTLEGPWSLDEPTTATLGTPSDNEQVWLLRCPARRGAPPSSAVIGFDEWARAFPTGMPVGVEQKVLDVMRRIAHRLRGSVRVAGSGVIIRADADASVSLRVLADQWVGPDRLLAWLSPYIEDVALPNEDGPASVAPGMPYALLAPVTLASQILIGVRPETFVPRVLRWERWAKPPLIVYEVVWAAPEELASPSQQAPRSRRARLERNRAEQIAETVAAVIATSLPNCAVIDEDGFLLSLDEPPQVEEQPRP